MLQLQTIFASTEAAVPEAAHDTAEVVSETTGAVHEAASDPTLFGALGIDWRMLLLQILAFVVLLWVLNKFVYPHLLKAIDARQEAIEAGLNASKEAQDQAKEAEKRIAKELEKARKQADEIIDASHKEAASVISDAEEKASRRAESIVSEAKADLNNQVLSAKKMLAQEARALIGSATEQIIGEKLDASKDAQLVDKAIKSATERA